MKVDRMEQDHTAGRLETPDTAALTPPPHHSLTMKDREFVIVRSKTTLQVL